MPVSLSLDLLSGSDLLAEARSGGTVADDVLVQFLCNTGPGGEHDPNEPPDGRVRPSHAALHGRIFTLADAPVPPLDYGCRCAIRFVSRKGAPASQIAAAETSEEPTTPAEATAQWLDANVDGWRGIARDAKGAGPKSMLQEAVASAKDAGVEQPRAIAEMILDVLRSKIL